jgi:hypothetical protein
VALRPSACHVLLIPEVSRAHNGAPQPVGLPGRPLLDNTQHSQQTFMPPEGFEPAIPASERLQTYALYRHLLHATVLQLYFQPSFFFLLLSRCFGAVAGQLSWTLVLKVSRGKMPAGGKGRFPCSLCMLTWKACFCERHSQFQSPLYLFNCTDYSVDRPACLIKLYSPASSLNSHIWPRTKKKNLHCCGAGHFGAVWLFGDLQQRRLFVRNRHYIFFHYLFRIPATILTNMPES